MYRILVTGGAGFIGSHFVRRLLRRDDVSRVTVLDALTYAGHTENLGKSLLDPRLTFVHGNILDAPLVDELMARHTAVVHFAAESHVDRSLTRAGTFLTTNVLGTQTLAASAGRHGIEKFVHVSTDEVYGSLSEGSASEDDPLRPGVPYAASKAAGDLVALSHFQTYGLPLCVTRSSNNYGPHQFPEKVVPLFITSLLRGEKVTLHGQGQHVRNWLHVEDNCAGVELGLYEGKPGEIYNVGGGTDLTCRNLTAKLLDLCGKDWDSVTYVPDRQANDLRYSMLWDKISALGFRPIRDLDEGLAETVAWYRRNPDRWAPLTRTPYVARTTDATTPAAGEEARAH
ncbi:dTDP-glucose 4,6-dehydratase [Streptomyces sp. SID3212]|uniref:dTDP-glucose 4,6-dehydratase n=1 Tax=Streptomyces sp. SID3212 TaxID=2690259 RepID=UPI00137056D6|nr:dTDP-glucose 4,6-dehydratase [Streptomyces sp. SID3212]MYV52168.1 NAD-dependent epimerase/dehydratase family protein [Streptomyces sp. SID3212]